MKLSHNQIVSADDQDYLIALRDRQTNIEWAVGDKANEIFDKPATLGITRAQVNGAVGFFFGKPARTVRYYADTARYISQDLRDEYHNLPFGMFALACRPELRDAGRIEEVLAWASENSASIDSAEFHFEVGGQRDEGYDDSMAGSGVKITTIRYKDSDELRDAFQEVINDFLGDAPEQVRVRASWHIKNMFEEIEQSKVKHPEVGHGIAYRRT